MKDPTNPRKDINGTAVPDDQMGVNGMTIGETRALRAEPTPEGIAWAKKALQEQPDKLRA